MVPVKKVGVKTHPWDFQEGLHHNFKDTDGNLIRELHAHRLVVNHTIEENSPEKLQFAQFNNYRLPKNHPDRDTKLVKRVTTDRKGTLRLYYNSKNEIRNAATGHSAKWARDTWPHFLVNQRMMEPVPLADFERLDFRVSFQVDQMKKLSNWPNAIRGAARSGMNLKFMFFLRNPDDSGTETVRRRDALCQQRETLHPSPRHRATRQHLLPRQHHKSVASPSRNSQNSVP